MLESIQTWVENVVDDVGAVGLAFVMFLENVFPPIPSEIVLPLAGFYVEDGRLGFVEALVGATVGATAGALLLYAVGRYGGMPLVLRYRRVLRVSETEIERADAWFDRYGDWIVFFSRMIPIIRSIVSIPAGMSEMPVVRFTLLTAAGATVWNTALIGAGYALGGNYEEVEAVVGPLSRVILVVLVLTATFVAYRWYRRRRAARVGAPPA
jgi:membrane protein DedA with SNARE-associated domain